MGGAYARQQQGADGVGILAVLQVLRVAVYLDAKLQRAQRILVHTGHTVANVVHVAGEVLGAKAGVLQSGVHDPHHCGVRSELAFQVQQVEYIAHHVAQFLRLLVVQHHGQRIQAQFDTTQATVDVIHCFAVEHKQAVERGLQEFRWAAPRA